jgi:hypothetical protein
MKPVGRFPLLSSRISALSATFRLNQETAVDHCLVGVRPAAQPDQSFQLFGQASTGPCRPGYPVGAFAGNRLQGESVLQLNLEPGAREAALTLGPGDMEFALRLLLLLGHLGRDQFQV